MFLIIFNLFMILTNFLVFMYLGRRFIKPNGNIIMGSKLPHGKLDDPEILKLINRFKKENRIFLIFIIVAWFPEFLIDKYTLFCVYYLFFYYFIMLIIYGIIYKKYFKLVQKLKDENDWYLVEKNLDEDQYWGPFFYNNPHDKRVLVEDRFGTGSTINIGNKKGKIINAVIWIFTTVIVVGSLAIIPIFDNADYTLEVKNNKVIIDVMMYGKEIKLSDISDVKLINNLPKSIRIHGIATNNVLIGKFNVEGYGNCHLYITKPIEEVIVFNTGNEYMFINSKESSKTLEYYNLLKNSQWKNSLTIFLLY